MDCMKVARVKRDITLERLKGMTGLAIMTLNLV